MWTGAAALERGLVDALGGVNRAVAIAKKLAEIPEDERVTVLELSRKQVSPLALLSEYLVNIDRLPLSCPPRECM